ncbi:18492_t:CDS:2 [Racocetra persica]|uniref:18492_t:CDS:1 n=1 Tax=Racocetra persica TaxID=160502 RepID=A0ACA9LVL0_9GLOM|nr:18492_t:CDS:2 [Racocetra persica]
MTNECVDFVIHEINGEDKYYSGNFSFDDRLSEVRKHLRNYNDVYMGENMVFLKKNRIKISDLDEENFKVSDICADGHIHILKDPTKPSLFKFVNENNLLHGCYFEDDNVKRARKAAFMFKNDITAKIDMNNGGLSEESVTYTEEIERVFAKNYIKNVNADISLPWAVTSIKVGMNAESSSENYKAIAKSYKFGGLKWAKCSIQIFREEVEPTGEFIKAIERALTSEDKLDSIKQLSQEFGFFLPLYIEFGGRIQYEIETHTEIHTDSKKKKFAATPENVICKSYAVIGGDETIRPDVENRVSLEKWTKSLGHFNKWKPISYSDIISVYELLDDNLQAQLLELLGKVVLYSDFCEIEFNDKNIMNPRLLSINDKIAESKKNILANMANNQIFATVYNFQKVKEVFSVHVVYSPDEIPYLVVNCIKTAEEKEKLSRKRFKYIIKVAWMIVGFRTNFKIGTPLNIDLNSFIIKNSEQGVYHNSKLNCAKQDLSKIYKFSNELDFPLGICAFKCHNEEEFNEIIESNIIAGLHFCQNKHNWMPCNNGKRIDVLPKSLEIHWCTINTKHEPEKMIWRKWNERSMYKGLKRKECYIDMDKKNEKLFFSLLHKKEKNTDICSFAFVNACLNYPTLRLFGDPNVQSNNFEKIGSYYFSYSIVP